MKLDRKRTCPYCNATVADSNYCSNCGRPLKSVEAKVDDALVALVRSATSLVSGTGKLLSALGEVVEKQAVEDKASKAIKGALASLGSAIREVGDAADRLSKEAAEKAEREIRRQMRRGHG